MLEEYDALEWLSEEENEQLLSLIAASSPSDRVVVDEAASEKLWNLFSDRAIEWPGDLIAIPSDLFFAGTVPLLDTEFEEAGNRSPICAFRVVVFKDYRERITIAGEDTVTVGAIIREFINNGAPTVQIVLPLSVVHGENILRFTPLGWANLPRMEQQSMGDSVAKKLGDFFRSCLCLWYGTQLALLHPLLKEVFRNPQRTPMPAEPTGSKKRKKKPPLRYIKRHVLNADKLEAAVKGHVEWKTLCWRVIGHWRTYKDGRKVFINGYWKGPLRETKALEEARLREVVFDA